MRILAVLWTVCLVRLCYGGDDLEAQNSPEVTEQKSPKPEQPVSPFLDKVDTSLFNLENGQEDVTPVLKLTAKEGVTAKSLTYGEDKVWEDKKKSCPSAVLYMDGEKPTLAVLVTRDNKNKQGTVYRYHDGKKWKNGKEKDHKTKLEALKEKFKPADKPTEPKKEASPESEESTVTESAGKDGDVPSLKSDPGTIDINQPDNSQCQAFDYYYDDNLTRLIVPLSGKSIVKLKDATKKIWSLGSGEILQHAKVYLNKDKKAEVMFVVMKKSSGISRKYYVKNDIGWIETLLSFPDRINEIKAKATNETNVTIDIGNEKDTDQCHLISTELLGLKVKMFVPRLGYLVKEVMSGDDSLWKAAENSGERCLSCDIYTKENNSPLLLITIKDKEFKSEYFEKGEGGWKSTTKEEFGKKRNAMQTA